MKKNWKVFFKIISYVLVISLLSIILAVLIRVFFVATFKIPTYSMDPAVQPGDFIVVNKMIPGPRVFTDWRFLQNNNWQMKRWKGIRSLKRGEVVVFNFPKSGNDWSEIKMDFNLYYVKRILGMPGDTLRIVNGLYTVNNVLDTLGNWSNQMQLTNISDSLIDKSVLNTFPFNKHYSWTIKDFGPIYIPCADECLKIDSNNLILYKELIEYESGEKLNESNGIFFLGGKLLKHYTFRNNYYFMAGDQVLNSQDSRYWGLLPEDHIVGKASFILRSEDLNTGEIRWNRVLKKIK